MSKAGGKMLNEQKQEVKQEETGKMQGNAEGKRREEELVRTHRLK